MLTLTSSTSRLSLDVLEYQFPGAEPDGWDSEWLRVAGSVQCERGVWQFSDPCLTTFELSDLAEWLRTAPSDWPIGELRFTEPNLRFFCSRGPTSELVVRLSHECSPPWATEEQIFGVGYTLVFPMEQLDIQAAASAVARLCEKFPDRSRDLRSNISLERRRDR